MAVGDSGLGSIDPQRLPRDPYNNCAPVYPWNFVRTNTIFGVAQLRALYTAWSDKHPAYLSVSGPGNGKNVDDFFGPEINSAVVPLNVTTPDRTARAAIRFRTLRRRATTRRASRTFAATTR